MNICSVSNIYGPGEGASMARHHRYSKRSRESRKAMTEGIVEPSNYFDIEDGTNPNWPPDADEPDQPPGPAD
jgi:hypothetical protein